MSRLPVVAVVGRPNVGKSTLVNRIIGRREAIVEEAAGVTRDRKEFRGSWTGQPFVLVDTGGWVVSPDQELADDIRHQAEAAVDTADAVLFVLDARVGVTDDDAGVAELLRRAALPVVVAANKVDDPGHEADVADLWSLGLGEPMPVSALHGRGTGDLLDRLVAVLPETEEEAPEAIPGVAIIGRPNVGKSTLLNALLGQERTLVSPTPGTTRDPVDVIVEANGMPYRLVDTAGIRRASRVDEPTEYYAVLRARRALERADVSLLVIDGVDGVTHQDQRLADEVVEAGLGLVILVNKWDLLDADGKEAAEQSVVERLGFVAWAPALRISALSGARLGRIWAAIDTAVESRRRRIGTGVLNQLLRAWQDAHPPPPRRNRRPRILYGVQAGIEPPTFVLFARGELAPEYLRFLENRLRAEEDFTGSPIRITTRRSSRRPARV